MAQYLFLESRDPFESSRVADDLNLAASLASKGNSVRVFLVQNGVLPARRGATTDALAAVSGTSVEVLADSFSLRERGIGADEITDNVKVADLDVVVDALAAGTKTVWL